MKRAAGVLLAMTLLAGCGGEPKAEPTTDPSASTTAQAPAPVAAPPVGSCHNLDYAHATQPTDESAPVPCKTAHTTQTIYAGPLQPIADGHLLAVDSKRIQAQLASTCPGKLAGFVGGSEDDRRLSRLEVVWFSPTVKQSDGGANWMRCDVVLVSGRNTLARLPEKMRGALDQEGALDRFGTCGTAAPDKPNFVRVVCAAKHSWRAIGTVNIDPKAKYLAKPAADAATAACKDQATDRADGALKYTYSFEWPNPKEWNAGRRWGLCWMPE